jgi:ankyrin repeat protein
VWRGSPEVIRLLLEKGAQVDIKDHNRLTALEHARSKHNKEIEKLLIEHGAEQ